MRVKARIGLSGYAEILARIKKGATISSIVREGKFGKNVLYNVIPSMWKLGRVHIAGWELPLRSKPVPIWKLGAGDDAERPTHRRTTQKRRVYAAPLEPPEVIKPEVLALELILSAIETGATKSEIVSRTGLSQNTVIATMGALVKHGLAHCSGYRHRHAGKRPAVYTIGPGKAAPYPKIDRASVNRAYRLRRAIMQGGRGQWSGMVRALAGASNDAVKSAA